MLVEQQIAEACEKAQSSARHGKHARQQIQQRPALAEDPKLHDKLNALVPDVRQRSRPCRASKRAWIDLSTVHSAPQMEPHPHQEEPLKINAG